MPRSFFDVIVLGAELGPLLVGALLARRGYRVLVLEQDAHPPAYAACERQLPREPTTFLCAASPIAQRTLGELALLQSVRRHATRIDPVLQVVLPDLRTEVPLEEPLLDRELARAFPDAQRPTQRYYRFVDRAMADLDAMVERDLVWPPTSFLERREFARATAHLGLDKGGHAEDPLADLPASHPFRLATSAPARFASHKDKDQGSALSSARLYGAWWRGSASLDGGGTFLRDGLIERIQAASGEVRLGARAERILIQRRTACGVTLGASGDEIGSQFVIAGSDVDQVTRLLPDSTALDSLFEDRGEPQPRFYRYTLNLVLAAHAVPVGMGRDVFFVADPRGPQSGTNLLRLMVSAEDARAERTITVEALLPRRHVEDSPAYLHDLRERILAVLDPLLPFARPHLRVIDSPHDGRDPHDCQADVAIPPAAAWRRGHRTMRIDYGYPTEGALGVCGLPVRTPVRRLLLVNRQIVPGLGEEGLFLAAWSAARLITRAERRKWRGRTAFGG
jgi:hypothetical protein